MKQSTMLAFGVLAGVLWAGLCPGAEMLESFEGEAYPAVAASGCKAQRVQEHASEGAWALRADFPGSEQDTWPGLSVRPQGKALTGKEILYFDVYNPSDEVVYLSIRLDSGDGRKTFGGKSLAAGSTTTVELWLSSFSKDIDVKQLTQILPYIRMPREDVTLYFDHFRFETQEGRFKRLGYIEISEPGDVADGERQLGCRVFRRPELGHVFRNSLPWPGEAVEGIRVFAAQGEIESVSVSLNALRELASVAAFVSPLSQGKKTLSNRAVEVGCVRHLNKKTTYSSSDFIADLPVYVESGNEFTDVPVGGTRTFRFRFRVPVDAEAGLYEGIIVLRSRWAEGAGEFGVPVELHVLPFALPEVTEHFIGEYYRPKAFESDEEWKAAVMWDLADMRDHGMTSLGLCTGIDGAAYEDGEVRLAFDGTTRFEHLMAAYTMLGFPMPIIMLSDTGQGIASKAGPFGSAEYDAAYKAFWTAVQTECQARGWPEIIVQPVDEPGWKKQEDKDRNVRLLKLLKEIPGMRTEQDGPGDGYFTSEAGPFADVWNYNGSLAPFDKVREVRKEHLVAFYNNDVESYRPEVDRYVCGFFQKAADIDGVFNWEYRGGRGSLYDDTDGPTGDWVHYYPPCETSQGGPSLAWEAAREGVDDLRYVCLLESWIAKARGAGAAEAAARAEGALARILESLAPAPGVRGRAAWSARWSKDTASAFCPELDPDAAGFIGGFLKQPNGWTHSDYQRARWAVASLILDLMAAAGEEVALPAAQAGVQPALSLAGVVRYPEKPASEAGSPAKGGKSDGAVPLLAEAPKLDGNLDDAVWDSALAIESFMTVSGDGPAEVQTQGLVGWHGKSLYVGVRCVEPHMAGVVANCMEDGEAVWLDDCVEIFLDPGGKRAWFSQLVFNSKGIQFAKDTRGVSWKDRVPVEVVVAEGEWRIEAAIPLTEVLFGGVGFGFNLCRERRAGGELELSCWKPTGDTFGKPSAFAALKLDQAEGVGEILTEEDAGNLTIALSDAFLFTTDVLVFETEWAGAPEVLAEATLIAHFLSGTKEAGAVKAGPPLASRMRLGIDVSGLAPGAWTVEVQLEDANGAELGHGKFPVEVLAGLGW